MGGPADTGTIDFDSDDGQDTGIEVDAATIVAAAVFNAVAMPSGMPDFQRASIERRADETREAAVEAGFVKASAGDLIDGRTREQRQKDAADEAQSYLASFIAQEERRRREEAWDASRVAIGGVAMSGEEWDAAYEFLSDPKMRERLVQSMTRTKGWSKDRAEKAADDALTLAQIAQKKKDGTITAADETKATEITRRNPDAAEMVKEAARMKAGRGYDADVTTSGSAISFLSDDAGTATSEYQNLVKASAARMKAGDDSAFTSAPSLVSHFEAARDAPIVKPVAEPPKPVSPLLVAQLDVSGPF